MAQPQDPHTQPNSTDCDAAQELVQRFARGGLEPREANELRAHCQNCEGCEQDYRQQAGNLASLGRERRVSRELRAKALRKYKMRQDVLTVSDPPTVTRARMRTLIYPLLFAMMMLGLSRKLPFATGPEVQAQASGVWLRGQSLEPSAAPAKLRARERVFLEEQASAQVRIGKTYWDLHGGSEVRFEGSRPPSLRMFQGSLDVRGAFTCFLPEGVLVGEEGAQARIEWLDGKVDCKVQAGAVRLITSAGEFEL